MRTSRKKLKSLWRNIMPKRIEVDYSAGLGEPVKVLYKGAWRKIIWEPSIIVNGKVIKLEEIFLPIKKMKGGRNND